MAQSNISTPRDKVSLYDKACGTLALGMSALILSSCVLQNPPSHWDGRDEWEFRARIRTGVLSEAWDYKYAIHCADGASFPLDSVFVDRDNKTLKTEMLDAINLYLFNDKDKVKVRVYYYNTIYMTNAGGEELVDFMNVCNTLIAFESAIKAYDNSVFLGAESPAATKSDLLQRFYKIVMRSLSWTNHLMRRPEKSDATYYWELRPNVALHLAKSSTNLRYMDAKHKRRLEKEQSFTEIPNDKYLYFMGPLPYKEEIDPLYLYDKRVVYLEKVCPYAYVLQMKDNLVQYALQLGDRRYCATFKIVGDAASRKGDKNRLNQSYFYSNNVYETWLVSAAGKESFKFSPDKMVLSMFGASGRFPEYGLHGGNGDRPNVDKRMRKEYPELDAKIREVESSPND